METFPAQRAAAPGFPRPLVFDHLELIEVQRSQVRKKEYQPLGRLERIELGEDCLPNPAPDNPLVGRWTADHKPLSPSLDYLRKGPLLGLSRDHQDVLITTHMPHPPALVDPEWKREIPMTLQFRDGIPVLDPPRKMEQSLLHRCWVGPGARWIHNGEKWVPDGEWFLPGRDGEEWMLFQPVVQILLFLTIGGGGWGIINCRADGNGRNTILLYDRKREEGHILFGKKEVAAHLLSLTPA